MLNELHDLAQSLKAVQVSMTSWHTHFKTCPKGPPTCYALLDPSGQITDLESISDRERIGAMRKWEVAAGVSFPAFNVLPLFEPKTDADKKATVELRKAITSKSPPSGEEIKLRLVAMAAASDSLWVAKEPARITKCLTTLPGEVAKSLGTPPDEFRSITDLIGRASKLTADSLHAQLMSILIGKIGETPNAAADWFDVLFFHSGKTPKKAAFVLELADRSACAYPANHARVQAWMNSQFQLGAYAAPTSADAVERPLMKMFDRGARAQAAPTSADAAENGPKDAFAMPAIRLDDSFPAVRVPVLGNVILRSMSSESPCQGRYGFADSKSCPVGQLSRQDMKNALEWIGQADRREKTWCDVSSLSGKACVLFAYPSEKPQTAPEVAGLIVGFQDDADPDGVRFEACASRVTTSLTALSREAPTTEIRIFVLTKPDGFRTKVLHSERYSVKRLLDSAEGWTAACRNLPALKIRQFGEKKGDKPFWTDPFIPYPAEVVGCLNTAWERAGSHAERVSGFAIGDGLGLLLERGSVLHTIATRAVRTLVPNSLSLVLALGQAHHQGRAHSIGKKHAKQALLLPSVFGLLLAKLGRMKGEYMKGPPFRVGRLLSLADQLHVQYCHGVRKGQVPPQLVGNSLMATALEMPTKALAMLSQRILPYQAWARTLQGGDEVRLAKYLLGELGRVSGELMDAELPATCGDPEKAEMLLGYLARSEKDNDSPTTATNTERAIA